MWIHMKISMVSYSLPHAELLKNIFNSVKRKEKKQQCWEILVKRTNWDSNILEQS